MQRDKKVWKSVGCDFRHAEHIGRNKPGCVTSKPNSGFGFGDGAPLAVEGIEPVVLFLALVGVHRQSPRSNHLTSLAKWILIGAVMASFRYCANDMTWTSGQTAEPSLPGAASPSSRRNTFLPWAFYVLEDEPSREA